MARYFLEVAYDGTHYGGFQIQQNANTIQAEVVKALEVLFRQRFELTGSSRTDAGVHARQNFFHFDMESPLADAGSYVYNLNAILPDDIVVKRFFSVANDAHCRFDALSREYRYYVYARKDPFLRGRAFYFPYRVDVSLMNEAAAMLLHHTDFTSFSKRNTQVKSFICDIRHSEWYYEDDVLVYRVISNRFLRGMVKALVGTMLRVGRGRMSPADFRQVIESRDCSRADFSVAPHGLFLVKVDFGEDEEAMGNGQWAIGNGQ